MGGQVADVSAKGSRFVKSLMCGCKDGVCMVDGEAVVCSEVRGIVAISG